MRPLTTLSLALAITLASAGSTVSQTHENVAIQRCNAGLNRSINVCNNMHGVGSDGWDKCIAYSVSMHRMCVMEAVEHMDTIEG